MFTWLSQLGRRVAPARRPIPSRPRQRRRPFLELLEDRSVPSTTTIAATPNPATPDVVVSFPVTVASTTSGNTDLQGNVTVVDATTGTLIDQRTKIFVSGVPGTPILFQFTASAKLSPGTHIIVAEFDSTDSFEPGSKGSVSVTVQVPKPPDDIIFPPVGIRRLGTGHRGKHHLTQVVTIKNTGAKAISGNLYLVVDGLSPGITLDGAAGVTTVHPPLGSPYVALGQRTIAPHKSIKVKLSFEDPQGLPLQDSFRLLEGTTTP
jgi:hypothetical protein